MSYALMWPAYGYGVHTRHWRLRKLHIAQPQLGLKLNRPLSSASKYSRITLNNRLKCASERRP